MEKLSYNINKMIDDKKIDSLTLSDAYLFASVMENEGICKQFLCTLLEIPEIAKIEYLEVEKHLKHLYRSKGVRLDVYLQEQTGVTYIIEMQVCDTLELAKRARFYGAMSDVKQLKKGSPYKDLKDVIVIFICLEDIFGLNLIRYTFENSCNEYPILKLDDGTKKIFFYTKGQFGPASEKVKALLHYIEGKRSNDPFIQQLDNYVRKLKNDEKWRYAYMMYELAQQDKIEWGKMLEKKEIAKKMLSANEAISKIIAFTQLKVEEIEMLQSEISCTNDEK